MACNLLSNRCKYSYCSPFSGGRTHYLFDWWNHVILCVGFLCTSGISSSSLLLVVLIDPMVSFRCVASVDPIVGALNSQ